MTFTAYNNKLVARARELRKCSTLSEVILWNYLKQRNLMGYRFLRQKPIGNYIVDFYCPQLRLVIEIDGSSHDYKQDYDKFREDYLILNGLNVIRFNDLAVKTNVESVVRAIREWIQLDTQ